MSPAAPLMRVKSVLAVILNWNGADFTRDCCASLAVQTHKNLHVLVVDNGSTTNTVDDLRTLCPNADVIGTGRNLGFAGGVNAGLKAVAGLEKYDYLWLLNNDTLCDPDALERLVAKADSDMKLAAVGCAMREGSAEEGTERMVQAGKRLRGPFYIPAEADGPAGIDYVCGACVLIRKEALADVGLLDEDFFFFFEDADWSFRAKEKGWKLGFSEGVPIRHMGGGTIRKASYKRALYYRAGHVMFLRKHARHPLCASLVVMSYRLAADLLRLNFTSVRGTIAGFRKGWTA